MPRSTQPNSPEVVASSIWHYIPSQRFRTLSPDPLPDSLGETTVVYSGSLAKGQPVAPERDLEAPTTHRPPSPSDAQAIKPATPYPTAQQLKAAIAMIFEGDLDQGNQTLIKLEAQITQARQTSSAQPS